MTLLLTIAAAVLLSFANGANDNAKGVATLIGGGIVGQRWALGFAAVTTFLGSLAAVLLAATLLARFGGKGILEDGVAAASAFPVAVGLAAAATVLLATVLGMPISTTHAMVGAIVGIGWAAGGLRVAAIAQVFFAPLLLSPLVAIVLAAGLYGVLTTVRRRCGVTSGNCVCVGVEAPAQPVTLMVAEAAIPAARGSATLAIAAGDAAACRTRYAGSFVGIDAQRALDVCHFASAGLLCFARGLNDTPKIAAIMLAGGAAASAGEAAAALVTVGVAIAMGGVTAVRRVARTMSHRITGMNDGQAFTANAASALLVIAASKFGLPVSTTHVTCGSLFGIGVVNGRARWAVMARIVGAWVATLPLAAVLGWLGWTLVSALA